MKPGRMDLIRLCSYVCAFLCAKIFSHFNPSLSVSDC
jgi:hypothetical protein